MENKPNIKMVRIDERLIHGQGQLWIKSLGVNLVIVANDKVSTDAIQQTLMKTVIPKEVTAGKEKVSQFIYLGEEDKEALRKLRDKYNVEFNTKTSPVSNDGVQTIEVLNKVLE